MNTAVKESFTHLSGLTAAAAKFTANFKFADISPEALRLSRRCILDGLSVSLAGSEQHGMAPLPQEQKPAAKVVNDQPASSSKEPDYLDIPAFLRKQAD